MPDPLDPVEALRRYGDHDADCPAWDERHSLDLLGNLNTDRGPCECGFDIAHAVLAARAALAALPAPTEPQRAKYAAEKVMDPILRVWFGYDSPPHDVEHHAENAAVDLSWALADAGLLAALPAPAPEGVPEDHRVCSHGIYHHGCPSCDRQDPEEL